MAIYLYKWGQILGSRRLATYTSEVKYGETDHPWKPDGPPQTSWQATYTLTCLPLSLSLSHLAGWVRVQVSSSFDALTFAFWYCWGGKVDLMSRMMEARWTVESSLVKWGSDWGRENSLDQRRLCDWTRLHHSTLRTSPLPVTPLLEQRRIDESTRLHDFTHRIHLLTPTRSALFPL